MTTEALTAIDRGVAQAVAAELDQTTVGELLERALRESGPLDTRRPPSGDPP